MAATYISQFTGTLEVLENPSAAGDRPATLLSQWQDHLRAANLDDVADELRKFEKTLAKGDAKAIGKALLHLGELAREQSQRSDDITLRDRLTQLASALTKTGGAFA